MKKQYQYYALATMLCLLMNIPYESYAQADYCSYPYIMLKGEAEVDLSKFIKPLSSVLPHKK